MFCVLYKFTVKSGYQDAFRQHWLAVTKPYISTSLDLIPGIGVMTSDKP
jgi:hypothetical protein